jgi:hypothetical protein
MLASEFLGLLFTWPKCYTECYLFQMILQFVSPNCYAHIYSEKLVHLPHCYFVNDYKQVCLHA